MHVSAAHMLLIGLKCTENCTHTFSPDKESEVISKNRMQTTINIYCIHFFCSGVSVVSLD